MSEQQRSLMSDPKGVDKLASDTQTLLEKLGLEPSMQKQEQLLQEVENLLKLAPPAPSTQAISVVPLEWVGWAAKNNDAPV